MFAKLPFFSLSFSGAESCLLTVDVTYDLTSFQDGGGDTGDPGKEGGPAERKREPAEKAGGERSPEEAEQRGEQVSSAVDAVESLCVLHVFGSNQLLVITGRRA